MKFIVDELPAFGYECPFFCSGNCHSRVSDSNSAIFCCDLFDSCGQNKDTEPQEECRLLRELSYYRTGI